MILIGICGASGSGKSTLADALANRLGDRCLVIQQDCYYRAHPDLSFTERAKLTYRADTDELIYPHDVVILEGIHCFFDPRLMKLMFLKLYMKVDADICLLRRIERDILERGRSIDSISNQYRATVRPMFSQYIANYVEFADIIVAGGGKNARIVDILAGYVSDELSKRAYEA